MQNCDLRITLFLNTLFFAQLERANIRKLTLVLLSSSQVVVCVIPGYAELSERENCMDSLPS